MTLSTKIKSIAWLLAMLVLAVFNSTESIRFLGPKLWETIPNELQQLQSLQKIKIVMKKRTAISCLCIKPYLHGIDFLNK